MNGTELKALFDTKWGKWRKFIATNPLTGSWISFAAGAGVMLAIIKIIP
jgi:hypothetical protein